MTSARSDLEIQSDLIAELNWDPRFAPAATLAARVAGVRAVHDHLEVLTAPEDDIELARKAALALSLDADVPERALTTSVREGVVTIRGAVDHDYQRRAAEHALSRLAGVRELVMDVEMRGHTRDDGEVVRAVSPTARQSKRRPGARAACGMSSTD